MDTDDDFGCLGIPTPLEMCKQHCHLIETENDELRQELIQAKRNIAKLVDMHCGAVKERDEARSELAESKARVSDLLRQVGSLQTSQMGIGSAYEALVSQLQAQGYYGKDGANYVSPSREMKNP